MSWRRTFISIAESLDIGGYTLKALLNHRVRFDVMQGYLVLEIERLREPMQRITTVILKAAQVQPSAEIVTLAKQREVV